MVDIHLAGGVVRLRGPGVDDWSRGLGPFLVPHAEPDFTLTLDTTLAAPGPPPGPLTHRRHDLTFAATADRAHACHDGHALPALLELALAAALPDGLLLHAAAAVIDDRAWLLPGPSGAGKSTAIRAIPHHRALSDERVAARPDAHGWRAHGTPWWSTGRTRPLDAGSAPIAGLLLLRHGPPAIRPINPDAAAARLVESTALYFDPAREAAFAAACDLAEAVPAFELTLHPDTDWPALLPGR
ncbi:MAG: hypothetical protein H6703_05360 [Myxococcales bacterium]|nr:hypothetical protein [Myxococcales bacterium]